MGLAGSAGTVDFNSPRWSSLKINSEENIDKEKLWRKKKDVTFNKKTNARMINMEITFKSKTIYKQTNEETISTKTIESTGTTTTLTLSCFTPPIRCKTCTILWYFGVIFFLGVI